MSERVAVLVTGSRDWTDYGPIATRLDLYPAGTILINGDCGSYVLDASGQWIIDPKFGGYLFKGADWIASKMGSRRKHRPWPLPYFSDLGKAGGPVRNDTMGDVLEVLWRRGFRCAVEGFPIGRSPGTRGCLFSLKARDRRLGSAWSFNILEGVKNV
jgi:hypothetical protein